MGVSVLAEVCAALIAAGMSGTTPSAIIEQGTLSRQRTVRAPLAELPTLAVEGGIRPPAIFVIGEVVSHADALDWVTSRPLFGARIGLFTDASGIAVVLEDAGAEVVLSPRPFTAATRLVVSSVPPWGWIVQSHDDLDCLDSERSTGGMLIGTILWCMESSLAARARARGWTNVVENEGGVSSSEMIRALHRSLANLRAIK